MTQQRWTPPDIGELALRVGRLGWVAKGVVYSVFGLLAVGLGVAVGAPDDESTGSTRSESIDQQGALDAIAARPFGAVLLVVVAVGLVIYSCWRWYTTFGTQLEVDVWHRLGYGFSAVWYLALAWGAAASVLTGPSRDSDLAQELSARLLGSLPGSLLVAAAGLVAIAAGVVFGRRAIDSDEPGDHDPDSIEQWPDWAERVVEWMGRIGWGGRAALTATAGAIALVAAVDPDVQSAEGFDGTIREFATRPFGGIVVTTLGLSLVAYGAYCVITAAVRRPSE